MIKFNESVLKTCSACRKDLPLDAFSKDASKRDGLRVWCRKCSYEKNKAYWATARGKERLSDQTKRRWIRTKYKVACRTTVASAIQRGELHRQPCAVCGSNKQIESHHEDYTKPFEIVWLCRKHHLERHGKRKIV